MIAQQRPAPLQYVREPRPQTAPEHRPSRATRLESQNPRILVFPAKNQHQPPPANTQQQRRTPRTLSLDSKS